MERLTIGKVYPIDRKILRKYVENGWDTTIYNSGVKEIIITGILESCSDKDFETFKVKRGYYINNYNTLYLPEDVFISRKAKLKRILK